MPAASDDPRRSRPEVVTCGGRFQAASTTITPMKEIAFSAKTSAGPLTATRTPAMAGPIARAPFTVTLPSDAAAGNSSRGTSSG
jgi:hypothetical protein